MAIGNKAPPSKPGFALPPSGWCRISWNNRQPCKALPANDRLSGSCRAVWTVGHRVLTGCTVAAGRSESRPDQQASGPLLRRDGRRVVARLLVKGWSDFQHYKHRSPPWVKLHKKLLDNRDFQCLQIASKALAPMLWLLASESDDGSIDSDLTELSFRLRTDEKTIAKALTELIEKGFFIDASNALAGCVQGATTEKSREEKSSAGANKKSKTLIPECFQLSERILKWASENGHDRLNDRLVHFVSYAKRNGKTYVDWDEAFMGAVRENWAKLPEKPASEKPAVRSI